MTKQCTSPCYVVLQIQKSLLCPSKITEHKVSPFWSTKVAFFILNVVRIFLRSKRVWTRLSLFGWWQQQLWVTRCRGETFELQDSMHQLCPRNDETLPGCDPGPMLWFLKIFSPKSFAKKMPFLTQGKAKFWIKMIIITLVFQKNAENWQKLQKIVIITSTPDVIPLRWMLWISFDRTLWTILYQGQM
jgi:hypothetical protein